MKDFKTIEDKILYLHNKYPQLRDKSVTETIIAYTLEFIEVLDNLLGPEKFSLDKLQRRRF